MSTLLRRGTRLLRAIGATTLAASALTSAVASAASTHRLLNGPTGTALLQGSSVGRVTGSGSGATLPEARASYSTIDFPGAGGATTASDVIRTGSVGNPVEVVGWYGDHQGNTHGFVMSGGHYRTLDFPGATSTMATGLNSKGDIVGVYGPPHGDGLCSFLCSAGTYSTILTGCPHLASYNLQANGINNSHEIVADFVNSMQRFSGALNIAGNNEFGFTYPGSTSVYLKGINDNPIPEMVGSYAGSQSHFHGLVFHGTEPGNGTSFDVPRARGTVAWDVNDTGQIVGNYFPPNSYHGFVEYRGRLHGIDFPGSTTTFAYGIDNRWGPDGRYDVVGYYQSSTGSHAFIATVSNIAATLGTRTTSSAVAPIARGAKPAIGSAHIR